MNPVVVEHPVSVFIVCSQLAVGEAVSHVIDSQSVFATVGLGVTWDRAINGIREHRPDVVLLVATSEIAVVTKVVERLKDCDCGAENVLMFDQTHAGRLLSLVRRDTVGCLFTSDSLSDLATALEHAAAGEPFRSESVVNFLRNQPTGRAVDQENFSPLRALSLRQIQVLKVVAEGMSTKEAASELHMSPKSIESHTYRLMKALGVHGRVRLAHLAIREGLITP